MTVLVRSLRFARAVREREAFCSHCMSFNGQRLGLEECQHRCPGCGYRAAYGAVAAKRRRVIEIVPGRYQTRRNLERSP